MCCRRGRDSPGFDVKLFFTDFDGLKPFLCSHPCHSAKLAENGIYIEHSMNILHMSYTIFMNISTSLPT